MKDDEITKVIGGLIEVWIAHFLCVSGLRYVCFPATKKQLSVRTLGKKEDYLIWLKGAEAYKLWPIQEKFASFGLSY